MLGGKELGERLASASHTTACRVLAGIELITAFYGCLYAGCIPVTVRPPHAQSLTATLPTVRMIVEVSNGAGALASASQTHGQHTRANGWRDSGGRSTSCNPGTVFSFIKCKNHLSCGKANCCKSFPRDTNVVLPPNISH